MKPALLAAAVAAALTPLATPLMAQAQDTALPSVVVSSTKLDKDAFSMTQSSTVIDEDEIEREGYTDLTEVLRREAGIEFKQAGGPGQFNYLKMRGFNASNVLVVVDGVVINKASSGDIGNLMSQLDPTTIERIEILRGPQAVLYGANSTAGVIAVTTKRGNRRQLSASVEAGSLGWKKAYGSWRDVFEFGPGVLQTSVHLSKVDSDGIHAFEGFDNEEVKLGADYVGPAVDAGLSYWRSKSEFRSADLAETYEPLTSRERFWAFQTPDPNQSTTTTTDVLSLYAEQRLNARLSHRLQFGLTKTRNENRDPDDGLLGYQVAPFDGFSFDGALYDRGDAVPILDSGSPLAAHYRDESRQINYSWRYGQDGLKALAGVELYDSEGLQWGRWGDFAATADHKSVYLNGEYAFSTLGLILTGGLRHDDYDDWKRKTTGSVGASYRFGAGSASTVFANYGSSYRVPTLAQLHNPSYGNAALAPESGKTFEGGFRQQALGGRAEWEAVYWRSKLDDVVYYDYALPNPAAPGGFGRYNNGDLQRTSGLELSGSFTFSPALRLRGNYTYTDSHIRTASGDYGRTVQIARNRANLGADYQSGPASLGLNVYYTGPRLRWSRDIEKKEYVRVDASGRFQINPNFAVFTRIENLFDSTIEDALGYAEPGFYAIVGIQVRFR